jgi:hypothetical protein
MQGRRNQTAGGADSKGGQGGEAPVRSARAGGGVKGGRLDSDAGARAAGGSASRAADYASEYLAARARAEAALAQDRVPPELRDYVRRYFAAIRSPKQP